MNTGGLTLTNTTPLELAPSRVRVRSDKGGLVLDSRHPLKPYPKTIIARLREQARKTPRAPFLHERAGAGWRTLTYKAFLDETTDCAARLLSLGCGPGKPLVILAPNSINHAIVTMAGMMIGAPVAPVSPTYGMANSFERLRQVLDVLRPHLAYVDNVAQFARALPVLAEFAPQGVVAKEAHEGVRSLSACEASSPGAIEAAARRVGRDTVAKVLFTSGSTGAPKGVINTHRMLCADQIAVRQVWPFLKSPPSLVDWLPWSHTFGGNFCFNLALFNGGQFYIDEGKPAPGLIGKSIENLKLAPPSIYCNVPAGIEAILPFLESDETFARVFFGSVRVIVVAAASLPAPARTRMEEIAARYVQRPPVFLGGWGSTETAPVATLVHYLGGSVENIGVPLPGVRLKMKPQDEKLGLWVKGPTVTPGYWRNSAATAAAFDDEGFYEMGDAGRLVDPAHAEKGLAFDGRLAENFKLLSGTWVNVGALRIAVVERLRPLCTDAVVTGHNREDIGLLLVPNMPAIASNLGVDPADLTPEKIARSPIGAQALAGLSAHNQAEIGSSTKIRRLAFLPRGPDINRAEITDKGYINQRAMLTSWADLVDRMHTRNDHDGTDGIAMV